MAERGNIWEIKENKNWQKATCSGQSQLFPSPTGSFSLSFSLAKKRTKSANETKMQNVNVLTVQFSVRIASQFLCFAHSRTQKCSRGQRNAGMEHDASQQKRKKKKNVSVCRLRHFVFAKTAFSLHGESFSLGIQTAAASLSPCRRAAFTVCFIVISPHS